MPRLIPKSGALNRVANMLIPGDIKRASIEGFLIIAEPMNSDMIEGMIVQKASLWRDCLTDEIRKTFIEGSKEYLQYIRMANESLILDWVIEARPDLKRVLSTQDGKLWFLSQWNEITKAVGA